MPISTSKKKILVPTDFSPLSLSALHYAAAIAKYMGGEITLLHIMELYDENSMLDDVIDLKETIKSAVSRKLDEIKNNNTDLWGIKILPTIRIGKIHTELYEFIEEEKIELVVMGITGVTGMKQPEKHPIGTNTDKMIEKIICPVVTIRKPAEKIKFKTIVFPIDSTEYSKLKLKDAITVASTFGAEIHVLQAVTRFDKLMGSEVKLEKNVAEVLQILTDHGVKTHSYVLVSDNMVNEILSYAQKKKADLIMIVAEEQGLMNNFFISSNSRRMLVSSPIPVWTVKPQV